MIITCYILLTMAYAVLMLAYGIGWKLQPLFTAGSDFLPATSISVIIPARNEGANIEACIRSILAQHYPANLVEIIIVDDHSEDGTAFIAKAAGGENVCIVSLKEFLGSRDAGQAFKKKALTAGIIQSNGELIITTDADCIAPPQWLRQMAALYERQQPAMIIGPVVFSASGKLVEIFQSLDFTMMQGITAAAHRLKLGGMANGANLAFSRAAFDAVNGYAGIEHLASGDDYLLLHKMKQRFPDKIHYLKSQSAIIATAPQPDWPSFLQQRIRWASKSGKYADHRLTAILLLVYLFNAGIAALAVTAFVLPGLWVALAALLLIKTASELVLLVPVSRFFKNSRGLWAFPLLQPLHISYIILAGFLGMAGSYRWKGRKVR